MAETAEQRLERIVNEVLSGRRTLASVRQSVDRLAGKPVGDYSGVDDSAHMGSLAAMRARVSSIFANRGVALGPDAQPSGPDVTGITPPDASPAPAPPSDSDLAREVGERNTYEAILNQFKRLDLETLAPKILEYVKQGYDGNTITLLLQETEEYKKRFAGNEKRRAKGLPVLSPAEYLADEQAYRSVLRAAGLPPGFYDQHADFDRFIENDVAPQELSERVETANRLLLDSNSEIMAQVRQFYPELTTGDLLANLLDPERSKPLIDKKVRAAEIGAAGRMAGFSVEADRAEQWSDRGIGYEQAQRGFGEMAGFVGDTQKLASRFGESYSQTEAEDEIFGGLASARRKREQLYGKESALFEGGSGVQRESLGRRSTGAY